MRTIHRVLALGLVILAVAGCELFLPAAPSQFPLPGMPSPQPHETLVAEPSLPIHSAEPVVTPTLEIPPPLD